jgi:acyl transferase domain-containing protein/protein-L-isoaspartate O-methyltransferase
MSDFLARISNYSPKRLALLADELHARAERLERARREPIAIVGIGCRLPGDVDSPERYWQLLRDGVDAITEVPADRFDIDALFDADPDRPGKVSTRWGGFVGPVDGFDAPFFGISPREAQSMDPQQRLLLEVTWRALEHAGIAPPTLEGSRTGVYIGLSGGDYWQLLKAHGPASFDAYTASGIAHSIASGRLSYVLGLRGPSVSIDTACSSSLVAIHQAVQSLRRGECDLALAGGVNLILNPDITIALSRAHMMAPDGRCKAFDARADGFVRGEGCGMLVLKRLSDAQAGRERVLAVIRGTAANQDGRSNGLTAPNGPSQEAVLRDALDDAGIAAAQVGFVEAHGTGTSLGDPIEVQALARVLGAGRDPSQPLLIGSVKANVGHLEAAAGVAGLIKLALVLQHGEIPGQLHLREPNPFIPWGELPVRAPTALTPWTGTGSRIGGISSFGFSGTNVHMLLEQAPAPPPAAAPNVRPLHVLTVSARTDVARDELAHGYAALLAAPGAVLADIAHAANAGRAHFAQRLAVVAADAADAAQKLRLHLAHRQAPGLISGAAPLRAPRVAFVFTGQGSQHAGMARSLYDTEPVFRAELDRCNALLRNCGVPLLDLLYPGTDESASLDDTAHTQPALFALEYALARLWMSWGVKPHVVLGHSLGEYVAACIAGVCSLEDALALVAERGRLMGALPAGGAMAAVMASEERVRAALDPWAHELSVAAVNGPLNTVVSGAGVAIDALLATLQRDGIEASRLKVSHAFHSPLVEPMLDAFEAKAASLRWQAPQLDLVSNVSGERAGAEVASARYWRTHVREPVQFARGMQTLARLGADVVLEIGPHPTLLALGRACLEGEQRRWLPSLRRGQPDADTMMSSLAALYVAGVPIDWHALHGGAVPASVSLPGYPFQRERFWVDAPPADAAVPADAPLHPLLGHEVEHPFGAERLFAARLSPAAHGYLNDHRIHGQVLLPSPVHMENACAAARLLWGPGAAELTDLTVHQALALDGDAPPVVQYAVAPLDAGTAEMRALWHTDAGWSLLARARLQRPQRTAVATDLAALRAQPWQPLSVEAHYAWLASLGLHFGPGFRGIRWLAQRDGEALAEVQLPPKLQSQAASLSMHPALLDACFHAVGAVLPADARGPDDAFLLIHVDRLTVHASLGTSVWAHARLHEPAQALPWTQRETFEASLQLLDTAGRTLAEFDGLHFKRASAAALQARGLPARVRAMLHEVAWRELPAPTTPAALRNAARTLCDTLAARHGLDRYGQFLPKLDALASAYISQALRAMGVPLQPGARLQARALMAELGVLARHERLLQRLLEILGEDGWLVRDGDAWRVAREVPSLDADALGAALQAEHPDADAEIVLTQRCARELAPVLRGRVDPLALLFPGGSLADTERLYRNSPPAQAYNALIARVLAEAAAALPPGRALRVLEVGAGTGSTTSHVLPALAGARVEYTFTDVSPLFLNRAREKFAAQPGMTYRLLDVATAPAAQGFTAGSFDVVIGANVLHATADVARSLGHVRELLAPGGLLVLLEGTLPQRFGDLTVGLLDGWWAYTDTQRRGYALMPRPAWLQLLHETGFSSAEALSGDETHPVWSQQAVFIAQAPQAARAAMRWLVVPDRGGVAERLCERLRARGDSVQTLAADAPAEALSRALGQGAAPDGIVCLQALDHVLPADAEPDALMRGQQALIGGTLTIVQAAASAAEPPALWLVTRGAQSTRAGESADPAQATLWGMSHVIAIEQPQLRCRRIDLDFARSDELGADDLAEALQHASAEDQLALRGTQRLARRLVAASASRDAGRVEMPISSQRSYLVTGGLAGLGLRVARWLVERGARHLVLMARSAPGGQAQAQIDDWRTRGAQVLVVQGDVARAADVERMLAQVRAAMPALAGVVHAAGALDDGVLTALTWSRFESVMAAKVRGTWNLHRMIDGLDFLCLFSSGASLAGSAGQANHAAANAFVDALAWYRQARGLPTLSINWGPWGEIGAAVDRRLKQPGSLDFIAPDDGLAALDFLLRRDPERRLVGRAQAAVLATDWSHLAAARGNGTLAPLFAELAPQTAAGSVAATDAAPSLREPTLLERLADTTPNRRRAVLREHVRQLAAKVLGVARADELSIDEPLRALGLDSLMAVELRNLLSQAVGKTLPATVTFDHPSVAALAAHLAAQVLVGELAVPDAVGAVPGTQAPAATPALAPSAHLDTLDEDELALQLMNRLDQLGGKEPT